MNTKSILRLVPLILLALVLAGAAWAEEPPAAPSPTAPGESSGGPVENPDPQPAWIYGCVASDPACVRPGSPECHNKPLNYACGENQVCFGMCEVDTHTFVCRCLPTIGGLTFDRPDAEASTAAPATGDCDGASLPVAEGE
jgi:hypothetical protein